MDVCHQKLAVSYDYPVFFTREVFSAHNPQFLQAVTRIEPLRRHRLFVIVDRAVATAWPDLAGALRRYIAHHADRLCAAREPLVIEGGEAVKNDPAAVGMLHAQLHDAGMDRQSAVVIIGGGALLDMAGFAAATAHRGLRVVRVPTTVLAQNDAGLSVKCGVNAFGKKNFLGAFAPPFAVLNDHRFLDTLPRRDTMAGMAEAVKAALIRDADFFAWLAAHAGALVAGDPDVVAGLIRGSARIHLTHIATSGDPFESGSARPLDFGHWAAHKLESLSDYRLRHGEAVAIGIALDTVYSVLAGYLPREAGDQIFDLLQRLGLPLWDDALRDPALLEGLTEFREHLGGELTVTLLKQIGQGFETHEMDQNFICESIGHLRTRNNSQEV